MKVIDNETGCRVIELTRRNLQALLAKLDDPLSARALVDPDEKILVRAVESASVRGDSIARAALAAEGVIELTRDELQSLVAGLDNPTPADTDMPASQGAVVVRGLDDVAHYRDRAPGVVWMPTREEFT